MKRRLSTRLSRRDVIVGVASAGAAAGVKSARGVAAEFSYRLAWSLPLEHHSTQRLLAAAQQIARESAGRMEVGVFPSNVLGSSAQAFAQLRLGAIHLAPVSNDRIAAVVPVANITQVPFSWTSLKQVMDSLDSPLGRYRIDAIGKANLHAFAKTWPQGFRQTFNRLHSINTMEDFKGLKIAIAAAVVAVPMYRALGAAPTPTVDNEIYTSLQTHIVDGVDLPLNTIASWKLFELAKYFSFTNHIFQDQTLIMNGEAWKALPVRLQEIVDRAFNTEALAWRSDLLRDDASMESTLKDQGVIFNRPNITIQQYRDVVRASGLYAQIRDAYPPEAWALLERTVGRLA